MSEHYKEKTAQDIHLVPEGEDKDKSSHDEVYAAPVHAHQPEAARRAPSLIFLLANWLVFFATLGTALCWVWIDFNIAELVLDRNYSQHLPLLWMGIWLRAVEPIAFVFERGIWALPNFNPGYHQPDVSIMILSSVVLILLPIYLAHIYRNNSLSRKQKLSWSAMTILMVSLFLPLPLLVYWFKHMRPGGRTQ